MATLTPAQWRELEPLLDRALDLQPADRRAWLEELTRESPELAAQLQELIASDGRPSIPSALTEFETPTLSGLEVGAYRLERIVGQGGMGTVWLARRCDGRFEGIAAIKLLHGASASPRSQARFYREGSLLASLTHTGIAKLFDAGVSAAGRPYLVLEYVDGIPIDAFVARHRLSVTACVRLYSQVLSAVEHAHANLVVHRDIKPSNILVRSDGLVKLLDFGIAMLLEPTPEEPSRASADERLFTPYYAAPEQIRGEPVTTATDVYALAVLLYKLLSGRHPSCEDAGTRSDCIRAILASRPPQRRGLGDLDDVLQKALQREPRDRYRSVAAFAQDLEYALHDIPVSARPKTLWYRASRFARRNRLVLAASAVAASGLVVMTGVSVAKMQEARQQRDMAEHEHERADAVVEFQRTLLSTSGDASCSMRMLLDAGRAVLEQQAQPDDLEVRPRLLLELAAGYAEFYELGTQRELLTRAKALAEHGHGREVLPEVLCALADNLRRQGKYDSAWRTLDEVEEYLMPSSDSRQRAACRVQRALLGLETARAQESVRAAHEALQLLKRMQPAHSLLYFAARDALAASLQATGRARDSVATYELTLEQMDVDGLRTTLPRKVVSHNLALALNILGKTRAAQTRLSEAVHDAEGFNPSGTLAWQPAVHYAEVALYQGDPASALNYFTLLVEQARRQGNTYWEGRALFGRIRALVQIGDLDAIPSARQRLQELIVSNPHVRDTDDMIPDVAVIDGMRAQRVGDWQNAFVYFTAALHSGGYDESVHLDRLRSVVVMAADSAAASGHMDDAVRLAQHAASIAWIDAQSETESAYVGEARLIEGRVKLLRHDIPAARTLLDKAVVALRNGAGEEHPRTREALRLLSQL